MRRDFFVLRYFLKLQKIESWFWTTCRELLWSNGGEMGARWGVSRSVAGGSCVFVFERGGPVRR